jgi:hypothetical protein
VYLASDIPTAFARATAQRGDQWAENIRNFLNSWQLPFYSSAPKPFATAGDLISYFAAFDQLTRRLVEQWPGPTCILDATATSPADLLAQILAQFSLAALPLANFHTSTPIAAYASTYERTTAGPPPERLVIQAVGDQLQIDSYWPSGTRLISIQEDVFRLESADRWVRFERDSSGRIAGLRYQQLGQQIAYRKIDDRL